MGMTSAAEAKLDARIRPEIAVLRSRTSYPRRSRGRATSGPALAVLRGDAEAGQAAGHACAIAEARGGGAVVAAAAVTADGAIAVARSVITQPAARWRTKPPRRPWQARAWPRRGRRSDAAWRRGRRSDAVRRGRPVGRRVAVGSDAAAVAGAPARAMRSATPARDAGVIGRGSPRRAVHASQVRLTRRGKIVLGVLVAMAVAGMTALIWFAIAGQAEAAGRPGSAAGGRRAHDARVVVRPGETLWGIAVRTDPRADPRAVIQEIIDDNALRGTAIQAGQVLWVPRADRLDLGRDPLGHDHPPGIGDELAGLGQAEGRHPRVDPVVALLAAALEQESVGLGGDERRAFLLRETETESSRRATPWRRRSGLPGT